MVPEHVSHPEVRGDSLSEENENRREHRPLFMKTRLLHQVLLPTDVARNLAGHSCEPAPAVPNDKRSRSEPFQALRKKGRHLITCWEGSQPNLETELRSV